MKVISPKRLSVATTEALANWSNRLRQRYISPNRKVLCHRCGMLAPLKGSISALVKISRGKVTRLYLCAACCEQLREDKQ